MEGGDQPDQDLAQIIKEYLNSYNEALNPDAPDGDALTGLVSASVNCVASHVDVGGINHSTTASKATTSASAPDSVPATSTAAVKEPMTCMLCQNGAASAKAIPANFYTSSHQYHQPPPLTLVCL